MKKSDKITSNNLHRLQKVETEVQNIIQRLNLSSKMGTIPFGKIIRVFEFNIKDPTKIDNIGRPSFRAYRIYIEF
jgi:hypothetical protein